MGTQITPTGIKFDGHDDEQTAPVRSVNGAAPDSTGNITVTTGNDHSTEITNLDNRVTTLENTGDAVTSVNSKTGGVNITAGTNISIDNSGSNVVISSTGGSVETLSETLFYNKDIAIDNVLTSTGAAPFYYNHTNTTETYYNKHVPAFENFKIDHADKHKLVFYSQTGSFEVLISDLIDINPTSANQHFIQIDSEHYRDERSSLWFDGDDLYYKLTCTSGSIGSQDAWPPYRIDMHSFATEPLNVYSKSEVDNLVSSSGGGGHSLHYIMSSNAQFTTLQNTGNNILMAGLKYRISLIGAGGSSYRAGNYSTNFHSGGGGGGSINFYYTPTVDVSYTAWIGDSTYAADVDKQTRIEFSDGNYAIAEGGETSGNEARLFNGGESSYVGSYTTHGIFEFIDSAKGGYGWYWDGYQVPARPSGGSASGEDDSLGPADRTRNSYSGGGAGGMGGYSLQFIQNYGAGSTGGYDNGTNGAILIQWSY